MSTTAKRTSNRNANAPRWARRTGAITFSLMLAMSSSLVAAADDFEVPTNEKASALLPAALLSGPNFKVNEDVRTIGFFHQWTVTSDYGSYDVAGDSTLKKLIPELYAIAELDKVSRGEAFTNAVASAAKSPFQFGYDLITSPTSTVSAIPSGIFQIFENVGEAVGADKGPTEDSMVAEALIVSSWKRQYAADAGIDVYSSNEQLQKQLNRIGWAAAVGGLSISGATMAVSGPASAVFSNMRLAKSLTDVLRAEPPSRLRIINRDKLRAMSIPQSVAEKFLASTIFTPRAQTIIVANLEDLGRGVAGRDVFLTQALSAGDEAEATFYLDAADMLDAYSQKVAAIKSISSVGRLVMATTAKGRAFVPAPADAVFWTKQSRQVENRIISVAAKSGHASKVDLWITGRASQRAKDETTKLGVNLTDGIGDKLATVY